MPRRCDMCLGPYPRDWSVAGDGCEATCPGRRGYRRRDVSGELRAGRMVAGLHPQSRLIAEALKHATNVVEQRRVTAFGLARRESESLSPHIRALVEAFTALETAMTWRDWVRDYQAGVRGMDWHRPVSTEEAAPREAPRPSRAPQPESEPSEAGFIGSLSP